MKKFILAAALVALTTPAFSAEMAKCTNSNLHKTEMMLMEMKDPAMKKKMMAGMKELEMAKMAKGEHKMDDCMMHLDKAKMSAHK